MWQTILWQIVRNQSVFLPACCFRLGIPLTFYSENSHEVSNSMDLRTSEIDEPDPSSPTSHFTSECDEPDTESDNSPLLKRTFIEQNQSNIVFSSSSSSVCAPDSESDSESGELACSGSSSSYLDRLQTDLECEPLEDLSEGQCDGNHQSEDVHSSVTIDSTSNLAIIF